MGVDGVPARPAKLLSMSTSEGMPVFLYLFSM